MKFNIKKTLFFLIFLTILFILSSPYIHAQTVFFEDNFNDGNANGWIVIGSSGWNVSGGQYGIFLNPGLSNTLPEDSLWNYSWTSIVYDVDLTGKQGVDKNILLKFNDTSNFVEVHANDHGIFLDKKSTQGGGGILAFVPTLLQNGVTYHFRTEINNDKIKVFLNNNVIFNVTETTPLIQNWKIGLRAGTGATSPTEVWFDNVVVTELTTPTPTPLPTTKVVIVPGMGASWNIDALLNCTQNSNQQDWSLASYAADIYNPLLTAISNAGYTTLPYYYDWRKRVPTNANNLNGFINNSLLPNEKLDLVGHSMGGLLGRSYLEQTGSNNKLGKLLTVGSPHKGVPVSYPAWSGGDIWQDNFIYKIAMTLYLKHCGGLFANDRETIQNQIPSVRNLLPINDYLKIGKLGSFKPVLEMTVYNDWLPFHSSFSSFYNATVGSLSGTGFDTLSAIPIRDASHHDLSLGNWIDGKPTGKEKSSEGDGTILVSSSQIGGASYNGLINQTHSGLVASSEGINQILSFLGIKPLASTFSYSEPNSALIIIGYPANFWVVDTNGKIIKDKDGLASFINPKSGQYKLELIPKSNSTLFIVGQFLPNGQTLYKEYKLSGILPKFKTIKFDSENPQEDTLN